jgi:hypothetical protein
VDQLADPRDRLRRALIAISQGEAYDWLQA